MDAFFDKFAKIPMLQKIGGMIAVCAVIGVIFQFMVLSPKADEQQTLQMTINGLQNDLTKKREMVGDLTQYKREVEKLNQDLQKALKLLPNSSEIPSLLQKVSALAKKSGLDIVAFQPAPEIPQDFYAKVPVALTLQGSYTEITNFFDAIGKLSRIVNISNIKFQVANSEGKGASSGSKKVLTATCNATTFRFVPTTAEAPKPAAADAAEKK